MATHIVLLRGINVGGHAKVPMAVLRELAIDVGMDQVATYLQSGNLVGTHPGDPTTVEGLIHDGLAQRLGLDVAVLVRTPAELDALIAANPFAELAETDPTKVHVTFFADPPSGWIDRFDPAGWVPETFAVRDRALVLALPEGIGRSKLAQALGRAAPAADPGTSRNWRTVLALAGLAATR